jgi:cob(I)alamin adenosyltransferase
LIARTGGLSPAPARPGGYRGGMARDRRDEPVVLSRIYTRTGDDGSTALGDLSRVPKTDPRLAAYADVDEANCAIGMGLALGSLPADMAGLLSVIQNELFDVGADLCQPVVAEPPYPPLRVTAGYVTRLEEACDRYNADLPVLRSFILPGGTPGAALLHMARTIARRAERSTWAALAAYGDSMNPLTAQYLNRLADLLFILARAANGAAGDVLWKPGGER